MIEKMFIDLNRGGAERKSHEASMHDMITAGQHIKEKKAEWSKRSKSRTAHLKDMPCVLSGGGGGHGYP